MRPVTVYLALGANLGDRRGNIAVALERLGAVPGIRVAKVSELQETEPVDAPGTPRFLNGVVALEVTLPAPGLLAICQQLERDAGRDEQAPRNAPRPLDLDILLYGDETIDTCDLMVPHPRMFGRSFVMEPLGELLDVSALQPPARPRVIYQSPEFSACCTGWLQGGCVTGLVPTMGALHDGHLELVRTARQECDRVAVTIFVNPLQFGSAEDIDSYPSTLDSDLAKLREIDVDVVFVPNLDEVYPDGFCTKVTTGDEAKAMESESRPSHFEGVTTVVAKLFGLARPSRAYFGQKDAQQVAVLSRMVRDLDYSLEMRVCPIVRESDGLAMSSRNIHLDSEDRSAAAVLHRALRAACDCFSAGDRDADSILATARAVMDAEPRVRLDYLALRSEADLAPLPAGPVMSGRVLIAAYLGDPETKETRLIDNMLLSEKATVGSMAALPN